MAAGGSRGPFYDLARGLAESNVANSTKKSLVWSLGRAIASASDFDFSSSGSDDIDKELADRWECVKPVLARALHGMPSSGAAKAKRNLALHHSGTPVRFSKLSGAAAKALQRGKATLEVCMVFWKQAASGPSIGNRAPLPRVPPFPFLPKTPGVRDVGIGTQKPRHRSCAVQCGGPPLTTTGDVALEGLGAQARASPAMFEKQTADNAGKAKKPADSRAELEDTKTQREADEKIFAETKATCKANANERQRPDEKEEIIDVPVKEKKRDKFYWARVKHSIDGVWYSGRVQDIEMGATTKEKLYKVLYDDGDLQHLTLPEVQKATEELEAERRNRILKSDKRHVRGKESVWLASPDKGEGRQA